MAKSKISYICQSCGHASAKWLGRCPSCNSWDTFAEERAPTGTSKRRWVESTDDGGPIPITSATTESITRILTGIGELDRALGGGVVPGSLILVGGDPGIGKSTIMLQVAGAVSNVGPVLYVSGEESPGQIRMRGQRLNAMNDSLLILSETDVGLIEDQIKKIKPVLVVVDSIQTIYTDELPSAPGTVGQVREASGRLLAVAKRTGIPVFLIGHVTKEGAIAGPRLLEHMVDTVLYFEGEKGNPYRILRSVKNRFGSTNEIGVFEMKESGLEEVTNPSELFLADRPGDVPGSVVTACVNGTRPLLVEIQALVATTHYPSPRRTSVGFDPNRVAILMAIIEKRGGYHLIGEDVFVNVAGGVRIDETATDLAVVCAVVSSFTDKPIDCKTIIMGEVGLGGEVRPVGQVEARINEAAKLGFTRAIIPKTSTSPKTPSSISIESVRTVSEALEYLTS